MVMIRYFRKSVRWVLLTSLVTARHGRQLCARLLLGDNRDGRITDQNWHQPLPVDVGNSEEGGYPVTVTVRSGSQTKTRTLLLGS